jgi:hypothetical protein
MRDEVILHEKYQLVAAHDHGGGGEQRLVGAAVRVGRDGLEEDVFAVELPKLDAHPGGRLAAGEVEDVCAKFTGHGRRLPTEHTEDTE